MNRPLVNPLFDRRRDNPVGEPLPACHTGQIMSAGSTVRRLILACGIVAALTIPAAFAQQKVDTVVTNGKVLTVDADFRIVQALAINGGRIVARGTSAEV